VRAIPATEDTPGSALIKATDHWQSAKLINICHGLGHRVGGVVEGGAPINFSLSENFLRESIGRKGIFTLKLRKSGWTEQSKVVPECIFNKYGMQTNVLCE